MTEQVSRDVFHKPIREGLREIIRYSIEHGSDPDFIAEVIETNGFRLWSRTQPWRRGLHRCGPRRADRERWSVMWSIRAAVDELASQTDGVVEYDPRGMGGAWLDDRAVRELAESATRTLYDDDMGDWLTANEWRDTAHGEREERRRAESDADTAWEEVERLRESVTTLADHLRELGVDPSELVNNLEP